MNTHRIALVAALVILAACSTAPDKPATPIAAAPTVANIAGDWHMSMQSPGRGAEGKMLVFQNGINITGTLETPHGNVGFTGTVGASEVKFSYQLPGLPGPPFEHIGTVDGASMSGKAIFGSFGEGTFTAKRP